MKACVVYLVVTSGRITSDFIARFVSSYRQFPAGIEHDLFVVCNGGPIKQEHGIMFSGLNAKFYPRKNDVGWDLSAYMDVANGICKEYDMMACLGESVYFHRAGWLARFAEVWKKEGPGMYGPFATNVVRAHLQTTAFVTSPRLLRHYPCKIATKKDRYEFEHGPQAFWRRLAEKGYPVRLVTWDGDWLPRDWRKPNNILWRGDQSNCVMWANHCDHYRDADETRKRNWSRSADREWK